MGLPLDDAPLDPELLGKCDQCQSDSPPGGRTRLRLQANVRKGPEEISPQVVSSSDVVSRESEVGADNLRVPGPAGNPSRVLSPMGCEGPRAGPCPQGP